MILYEYSLEKTYRFHMDLYMGYKITEFMGQIYRIKIIKTT